MHYLIHCRNDKCKHYFEDGCFNSTDMIVIDETNFCESFEEGTHTGYMNNINEFEKFEKAEITKSEDNKYYKKQEV